MMSLVIGTIMFVSLMNKASCMSDPDVDDREVQVLQHDIVRATAAGDGTDRRLLAIDGTGCLQSQLDKEIIGICNRSTRARASQQLDILEALRIQVCMQLAHDLLRVLLRHQTEIYFAAGFSRNDRLRPLTLIATPQSIDRTGGQEHCFLQRLSTEIACQAGDPMLGLFLLLLGGQSRQQFALSCGRWPDGIIEAGNQNALLLIFEGPQGPDEPPRGIGQVTIQTGVRISLHRPYPQLDIHHATRPKLHMETAFVVRYAP